MNTKNIVNYVRQTPGNTNPSVIKSMVQNEKEQAVYESIESLKNSGSIGYETSSRVTAIEPGTYTFRDGSNNELVFSFVEGDIITINFEGEEYVRTAAKSIFENVPIVYAGNLSPFGGEDTKEPFLVVTLTNNDNTIIDIISWRESNGDALVTRSVSMFIEHREISKIDPKFLPEGGVGYSKEVVLTNDGNNEGKETINFGNLTFVRIRECIDLSTVTEIRGMLLGQYLTAPRDAITLSESAGLSILLATINGTGTPLVISTTLSIENKAPGTYVVSDMREGVNAVVTEVVLEDEIVPIDEKFLPGPLIIDLTSYGNITNGMQIPDGSRFDVVLDAIEKGRMIYVKGDIEFSDEVGDKYSHSGLGVFITGTQKLNSGQLALAATGVFPNLRIEKFFQTAVTLIVTPQGIQVFIAAKSF